MLIVVLVGAAAVALLSALAALGSAWAATPRSNADFEWLDV